MTAPRLLAIIGSGETAPTMTSVHVELFERAGTAGERAVMLDTPFGFQENADEIVAKAVAYFRESVGADVPQVRGGAVEVCGGDFLRAAVRIVRWDRQQRARIAGGALGFRHRDPAGAADVVGPGQRTAPGVPGARTRAAG